MSSPNSHSQVSKLQNTNADHVTPGSIWNKNKRVFCTYVTWGFHKKKKEFHRVSFFNRNEVNQVCDCKHKWQYYLWGQQTRPSTCQWQIAARATFGHSKCVQVFELGVQWDENWREELAPLWRAATWWLSRHNGTQAPPRWSSPHSPHTDGQKCGSFSCSSGEGARSCQQTVPRRSSHPNIGARTFQFWLQEGHFMYPASNSHTGCVANNIILEAVSGTEWLQIFFFKSNSSFQWS